jgi:hypothetical protein
MKTGKRKLLFKRFIENLPSSKETALEHRQADERCGRKWECACPSCKIERSKVKNHHAVALGAIGGSVKSEAKAKAVRENGKLGGWKKGRKRKGTK